MTLNVLVVTKGHVFDYNGFFAMFDENPEIVATKVEQPAAQVILRPENVSEYEAVVFYDMWGISYGGSGTGFYDPPADYVRSIEALLERGTGLVLMNHATVQWPTWPLWREVSGTSFMLTEGELNGETVPGSGYRGGAGEPHRNVNHFLRPVAPGHPVLEGLGDGFSVEDEIYIRTAGFEKNPDIVPLMRSDYDFDPKNFNPPPMAAQAEKDGWNHPRGTDLMVWAKRTRNSPVVVMDGGDGPAAYANPQFRKLLANSIRWVASEEARAWARNREAAATA